MSDRVRLLPDSVANQIAAGEVIQRPAAVIKELVENSVDAGATRIDITVRDGGRTLIQVADNGCGMSEGDARMAFERHATSKIRNADDLFSLTTMGFRGEALPSICAISDVEIKTRTEETPLGTRLVIKGSKVEEQEPFACNTGTVISVRSLFFNTPARRRFMKSDNVELSNIMREFERLALVNNQIHFTLDTGTRKIDLPPSNLRVRIGGIWRNSIDAGQLLPVSIESDLVSIEGFVSRPELARRRNPLQYLIVNGRNMRHPYFHRAIMSCYESLIASDTQPCYFLRFKVDPATIDVNIAPTKNEIKFEFEHPIREVLVSTLRKTLGQFGAVPSIDFNSDAIPIIPMDDGELPPPPRMDFKSGYNPFNASRPTKVSSEWTKLYDGFTTASGGSGGSWGVEPEPSLPEFTPGRKGFTENAPQYECLQFGLKYIVMPWKGGLMIIDQHRAHLKILYEQFMAEADKGEVVSQGVMFPEVLELDESQQAALGEVKEDMRSLGFNLEYEEGTRWKITGVPSMLPSSDARDTVLRILDSVTEDSVNYGKDGKETFSTKERAALVTARSAAIRRGIKLNQTEMEHIVSMLLELPDPALTPTGKPVYTILTDEQTAKMLS